MYIPSFDARTSDLKELSHNSAFIATADPLLRLCKKALYVAAPAQAINGDISVEHNLQTAIGITMTNR